MRVGYTSTKNEKIVYFSRFDAIQNTKFMLINYIFLFNVFQRNFCLPIVVTKLIKFVIKILKSFEEFHVIGQVVSFL